MPLHPILLSALLAPPHAPSVEARAIDAIVAVVDGSPITSLEVKARAAPTFEQIRRGKQPSWWQAEAQRLALQKALDDIIDDALFAAAAEELKISVGSAVADAMIDRAAAEMRLSRADYLDHIWANHGFKPDELRTYFRSDVVSRHVLSRAWKQRSLAPEPTDEKAKEAFRTAWLAEKRRRACIERRR